MGKPYDGGPAFPIVGTIEDVNVNIGMSLRDYFAASVLQGMYAGDYDLTLKEQASRAYKAADAMLAARRVLKE